MYLRNINDTLGIRLFAARKGALFIDTSHQEMCKFHTEPYINSSMNKPWS